MTAPPKPPTPSTIRDAEVALVDAEATVASNPCDPAAWAKLRAARERVRRIHVARTAPNRYREMLAALHAVQVERVVFPQLCGATGDLEREADQFEAETWDWIATTATTPA